MRLISVVVLSAFAVAAMAQQIHRWVDEQGQVHYSDQPPPANQASEVVGEITKSVQKTAAPAQTATQKPGVGAGAPPSEDHYSWMEQPPVPAGPTPEEVRADANRKFAARCRQYAAEKKQKEDAIIARCNANHETYCDSVQSIESAELERDMRHYQAVEFARDAARARGQDPGPREHRPNAGLVAVPPIDPLAESCEAWLKQNKR